MKTAFWRVWHKLVYRYGKRGALLLVALPLALAIGGGGAYAALLLGSGGQGSVNLQSGLVGWWKMNGNALDASAYGNNGTVNGATLTSDRHGSSNKAYSFTGPDYIELNRTPQLSSSVLSYCAWIYPTNTSGTTETIFGPGAGSGPQFRVSAGKLQFLKSSVISIGYSSGTVTQDAWNHVCVTYSSAGDYTFYINGSASGSGTNLQTFSFPANPLIGIRTISTEPFHGSVDEVRVYNRVISGNEASALYSQNDSKINLASGQNGLVARWNLDGNGNDATPYTDNLTLVGGATYAADRHGKANGALSLVSAGDYAEKTNINSAARFNSSQSFSLSAWIKPTAVSGLQSIIGQQRSSLIAFELNGNKLRLGLDDAASASTTAISAGTWTHVAATYDGSTQEVVLYINGQADGPPSVTYDGSGFGTGTYWFVGYESRFSDQFIGSIDDARIYNRVLSASEVASLSNTYDAQINLYGNGGSTSTGSTGGGLLGKWMFNGNTKDDTPYGNNGTVSGASPTSDRYGSSSSAYSFNGSGNNIDFGDISSMNSMPAMSVAGWIKTSSSGSMGIVSKDNSSTQRAWALLMTSGKFRFNPKGNAVGLTSVGTVNNNSWRFLVGTYDGSTGTCNLYLDGVLNNTASCSTGTTGTGSVNVKIGARSNDYFNGLIDDVRIYNRALSAGEVQSLYNQ